MNDLSDLALIPRMASSTVELAIAFKRTGHPHAILYLRDASDTQRHILILLILG